MKNKSQKLIRSFQSTKTTLGLLSHNDLTDEGTKPELNTVARYDPNQEIPLFSVNDANDVTVSLINVFTAVQSPKYNGTPTNQYYGNEDS